MDGSWRGLALTPPEDFDQSAPWDDNACCHDDDCPTFSHASMQCVTADGVPIATTRPDSQLPGCCGACHDIPDHWERHMPDGDDGRAKCNRNVDMVHVADQE